MMITGFLVLGIAVGLVSGGTVLLAGHAIWVAGLAYVGGGMLGLGLGVMLALMAERGGQPDRD